MILVKVCLFPMLLNVPDTVQPLFVTNETPLVHFLIFGVQFGETSVISLQLFSKENVIAHFIFTFPHLTWLTLTVSSTARVEEVVTKRRRARPRSLIFSKVWTLLALNALMLFAADPLGD